MPQKAYHWIGLEAIWPLTHKETYISSSLHPTKGAARASSTTTPTREAVGPTPQFQIHPTKMHIIRAWHSVVRMQSTSPFTTTMEAILSMLPTRMGRGQWRTCPLRATSVSGHPSLSIQTTMLSLLPDIPIELMSRCAPAAAVLGPLQTLEQEIDIRCTWT